MIHKTIKLNIDEISYEDRSEYLGGFSVIVRKNGSNNINEKKCFQSLGNI